MKIWTMSICYNEAAIIPFWLRHYEKFCDQMHVWDDQSTDGTRELLAAHPKVVLHDWPENNGMDEDAFLAFAYRTYPTAKGKTDWIIWCDMDEFVYHPNIKTFIKEVNATDYEVIPTCGFNMMGSGLNGLPKDDGRQLWEICPHGVHAPVYAKPVVFRPECHIRWIRGKHMLEGCNPKMYPSLKLKLLHYRFLGFEYTQNRNRRNYSRFCIVTNDKGPAWGVHEGYKGEGSPTWVLTKQNQTFNVLEQKL